MHRRGVSTYFSEDKNVIYGSTILWHQTIAIRKGGKPTSKITNFQYISSWFSIDETGYFDGPQPLDHAVWPRKYLNGKYGCSIWAPYWEEPTTKSDIVLQQSYEIADIPMLKQTSTMDIPNMAPHCRCTRAICYPTCSNKMIIIGIWSRKYHGEDVSMPRCEQMDCILVIFQTPSVLVHKHLSSLLM